MTARVKLCNVAIKFPVAKLNGIVFRNNTREFIYAEDFFHDVNAVRFDRKPNVFPNFGGYGALYFNFISTALNKDLIMNTFKNKYGITIGDYITEYRLNKAKTMLDSSGESIKVIATDCGFSDQNYFTKVFRNAFNVTPTEYRNSIK